MKNTVDTAQRTPVFPAMLALPLKMLSAQTHNAILVTVLNRIFINELKNGDLDFLLNRTIEIEIYDVGIKYCFTLDDCKLTGSNMQQTPDLRLGGTVYNYLLLASRVEDTDTLFFNRRLHMQGDTELGLYLKNFLDGLDMESHKIPATIESALQKILPLYERLIKR